VAAISNLAEYLSLGRGCFQQDQKQAQAQAQAQEQAQEQEQDLN
jgi:hypothetical protein